MVINTKTALAAAVLSLTVATASAQQAGHQMAGMASGPGGGPAMCAQSSEGVTRAIDVVNARIEDARQTNDASEMRAAIANLQSVFAQMKTQLADCVALASEGRGASGSMLDMDHSKMNMTPGTPVVQPGSLAPAPGAAGAAAMPGMDHSKVQMAATPANAAARAGAKPAAPAGGMDHSKMQMPAKPAAAKPAAAKAAEPAAGMDHSKMAGDKAATATPAAGMHGSAAPAAAVVFTVRTNPAPPRSGRNDFEVTLKDAEGQPISDAAVSLVFHMPAMPAMKADAAQLTSAGNGVYKGSGTVGMSGDWDVTITASRQSETLATKKVKLTAQ